MDATPRRSRASLAAALVTLVGVASAGVFVPATQAQAEAAGSTSRPLNVLLLGDSYSAGNGSRDSGDNRTYFGAEGCYRSYTNWSSQYVNRLNAAGTPATLLNRACSGGVTRQFFDDRRMEGTGYSVDVSGSYSSKDDPGVAAAVNAKTGCSERRTLSDDEFWRVRVDSIGVGSSPGTTSASGECARYVARQVNSVTPQTDLVLFTFGGNDIGFSDIVMKCFTVALRSVSGCREKIDFARNNLDTAMASVDRVLTTMTTNSDPAHRLRADAKIAYVSYPLLELNDNFELSKIFGSDKIDVGHQVRELGLLARDRQKAVVDAVNAKLGRNAITMVSGTPELFSGHEPDGRFNDTNPNRWIFETPRGDYLRIKDEFYHMNPAGHAALAAHLATYGTFGAGAPTGLRNDIDLVFVIDTTGSMSSTINSVKAYASQIANQLATRSNSYRFALVDYRDQPAYTGSSGDYPSRLVVPFTSDLAQLQTGLNTLYASGGGDWPESALSGLEEGLKLPWRTNVQKVAILMTDAPAHDPEPVSGLTSADVINHALAIDPVQIYSVDVSGYNAAANLAPLSAGTGGAQYRTADGISVPDAISSVLSTALTRPTAVLEHQVVGKIGQSLSLSAQGSYATDGSALSYAWDFDGDGTYDATTTTPQTTHTYSAAVEGLVTLKVTDGAGHSSLATTKLYITRDGDTIADGNDNCPDVFNPDQGDQDGDGTGDACDTTSGYEVPGDPETVDNSQLTQDEDGNSTPAAVKEFADLNFHNRDTLHSAADVDYFGIKVTKTGAVQTVLGGLSADYDLAITDTSGDILGSSEEIGLRSEKIRVTLKPGNYLLKVSAKQGQRSGPYVLTSVRLG
nr:PKD domain-containing protein [Krasilnikovia cinnamomea]